MTKVDLNEFAECLEDLFGFDRREDSLSLAQDIVRRYELEFAGAAHSPEREDLHATRWSALAVRVRRLVLEPEEQEWAREVLRLMGDIEEEENNPCPMAPHYSDQWPCEACGFVPDPLATRTETHGPERLEARLWQVLTELVADQDGLYTPDAPRAAVQAVLDWLYGTYRLATRTETEPADFLEHKNDGLGRPG